jgi:hypothetical protein
MLLIGEAKDEAGHGRLLLAALPARRGPGEEHYETGARKRHGYGGPYDYPARDAAHPASLWRILGCSFAALFPERTASLALVEGGTAWSQEPVDLAACVEEAHKELEEESFASWEAFFTYERESCAAGRQPWPTRTRP